MSSSFLHLPIDPDSAERLDGQGLRLGLVDTSDSDAFGRWLQADARGFHDSHTSDATILAHVGGLADRRTTGVWDDSAADAATPVSTVSSWPTELTVPGERSVTGWAISAVTVAPTHRRKGIARAMLEAELRTAAQLGLPLAMLTVSEATIYGRYGFAPAAMAAKWSIDTRRAAWTGPSASGRVHFISSDRLRSDGPAIVERARLRVPGTIERWDYLWDRMLGLIDDDKDRAKTLRVVRYDDSEGVTQGFAVFSVKETGSDMSANVVEVHDLVTVTDDAYAGLWRFLLEMDLVGEVTAELRSVEEPLAWQISNFRAARKTQERDHLWVRILDVAAALEARSYRAPGRFVLEIEDPLGFAAGRFLLSISADGTTSTALFDGPVPDDAAAASLSVNELSALYLGGVSAHSLLRAGRITELSPGSAEAIDASFHSSVAPWLNIWF